MRKNLESNILKSVLLRVVVLYLLHPLMYTLLLYIIIGTEGFSRIFKWGAYKSYIFDVLFLFLTLFALFRAKKHFKNDGDSSEKIVKSISVLNRLPFNIGIFISIGSFSLTLPFLYYCSKYNILITSLQFIFIATIGFILSIAVGMLFYEFSKRQFYYVYKSDEYKSLSLFAKFSVPILTTVFLVLTIASALIYRLSYDRIYSEKMTIIGVNASRIVSFADSFFKKAEVENKAYAKIDLIREMNLESQKTEILSFLTELQKQKTSEYIEMFYVANLNGEAPTSLGSVANISDRDYFKKLLVSGKTVFSEPIISKATGKSIMVCVVPVKNKKNEISGLFGSTLEISTLKNYFKDIKITTTSEAWLMSRSGVLVYHPQEEHLGKNINSDYLKDGFQHVSSIANAKDNVLGEFIFEGQEKYYYKARIDSTNQYLIITLDKADIVKDMNVLMIQLITALILLAVVIFVIILIITRSISGPIANTISILKKLAAGDLTQKNDIVLPDEFGDFLKHFRIFQEEITDVISLAMNSSQQLSAAAEELAATSASLSDGSSDQAAALEESSASLEEISSAIEMIAESAQKQSHLTEEAFDSIQHMNEYTSQVATFARGTLKSSNAMTEDVNRGNGLMQKTTERMNEIDKSTQEIADIVGLISDISDQVNLLALNAAIEAARAGDAGKGFAVVSDEIAKLAEQTASSAKNIRDLVETGLKAVKNGREYVDATSVALEAVVKNISEMNENIGKIADSSGEQEQSSREVLAKVERVKSMADTIALSTEEHKNTNKEMVHTIEGINDLTQSVAAGSEEISSSTEEISAQAEMLKNQIEFFKLEKEGDPQ